MQAAIKYNPADANPPERHWEKAIMAIKLNSFFSSVEQQDNATYRNKAIGIINNTGGNILFCCSDEAERLGIRKGMKLNDAKRLCPNFIQTPARYERYADVSGTIVSALGKVSEYLEVKAINQLYIDITSVQQQLGAPEFIAEHIRDIIKQVTGGISVSIGLAADKTTAAYAAKQNRIDGITIIPPNLSAHRLGNVPLSELEGVSRHTAMFLARRGLHSCGDLKTVDIEFLSKHLGADGKKLWYMTQGLDPSRIERQGRPTDSISDSLLLSSYICDPQLIENKLKILSDNVTKQLKTKGLESRRLRIAIRLSNGNWIGKTYKLKHPTQNGMVFYRLSCQLLEQQWAGESVTQIQIAALHLNPPTQQTDFLNHINAINVKPIGKPKISFLSKNDSTPQQRQLALPH